MSTWRTSHARIAVLGGSSETGYGTTGYTRTDDSFQETRYGWVARLARNAAAEWATVTDVYAMNGALIADFSAGGRWPTTVNAVDRIAATQPDMVLAQLLVNEYVNNRPLAQSEADLRALVSRIRMARPGVDVLLLTYPDIRWSSSIRPWADYAIINHRVAVDMGCGLLDFRQYLDSPGNTLSGIWTADKAHLADAGQAVETAAVWTLLWSLAL